MSHITLYDLEERQDQQMATPLPRDRGRGVKDFASLYEATPKPRTFSAKATPSQRRIFHSADLVAGIEEEDNPNSLAGLRGKSWRVFKVSPLFTHNCSSNGELRDHLYSQLAGDQVMSNRQGEVLVRVDTVKGLRGNREDADCVRIVVGRKVASDYESTMATMYFVSVDSKETALKTPATVLPLCLSAGNDDVRSRVFSCLSDLYDCVISPLNFGPEDLRWMTALWSGTKLDDGEDDDETSASPKDTVKLKFKPAAKVAGLDVVDVSFDGDKLRPFWKRVCDNNGQGEITLEKMEEFNTALLEFIKRRFGLNLDNMALTAIALPFLTAESSGCIRINRVDKIKSVLGFLTELCQHNAILSANPRLGISVDLF